MKTDNELHVIYGSGPLGLWTARHLLAAGKQVRMVNRRGRIPSMPAEVEAVTGDAFNPKDVARLSAGAHAVYQCAQPAYFEWQKFFPALQEAMIQGVSENGGRLVVAENLYQYGEPRGSVLTEDSPLLGSNRKGGVRKKMTESLFEAHAKGRIRVAAARGSDFFGPDEPIKTGLIFIPALTGKTVNLLGRTDRLHTFTYTSDFGKALAILGTDDRGLGKAWHVPSPEPVTQKMFLDEIEKNIGKKIRFRTAGSLMLGIMGLFSPVMRELPEMLFQWNEDFVMDSSRFQNTFGMKPTFFPDAIRLTLNFIKEGL